MDSFEGKTVHWITKRVFHVIIKPDKRLDRSVFELVKSLLSWNPRNRMSTVEALSNRFVGDGRMRFHSCMCACCSTHPSGKRIFTSELEPVPDRVFNDSFESNLPNISYAKGIDQCDSTLLQQWIRVLYKNRSRPGALSSTEGAEDILLWGSSIYIQSLFCGSFGVSRAVPKCRFV